jgi:hypothetical protein
VDTRNPRWLATSCSVARRVAIVSFLALLGENQLQRQTCAAPASSMNSPATDEQRSRLRAFASLYWVEQGFTDVPVLHWWGLPDGQEPLTIGSAGNSNPFQESLQLFDALYRSRLEVARAHGTPHYAITDLFVDDAAVFAAFRWHTVTGQLQTAFTDDADIALKHVAAMLDADNTSAYFEVDSFGITHDGVVWSEGLRSVSRLPESSIGAVPPLCDDPPISILPESVDDRLREAMDVWTRCFFRLGTVTFPDGRTLPGAYRSDEYGVRCHVVAGRVFCIPVLTPGFDCDDYADAFIWWFQRQFSEQDLQGYEFHVYQVGDGLSGHAMVVLRVGGFYWVIDPQTGEIRGPISVPIDGSSWPDPNLIVTDPPAGPPGSRGYGWGHPYHGLPKFYAPGTRPFYEPRPWHSSPAMRQLIDQYFKDLRRLLSENGGDVSCLEGTDWHDFAPMQM